MTDKPHESEPSGTPSMADLLKGMKFVVEPVEFMDISAVRDATVNVMSTIPENTKSLASYPDRPVAETKEAQQRALEESIAIGKKRGIVRSSTLYPPLAKVSVPIRTVHLLPYLHPIPPSINPYGIQESSCVTECQVEIFQLVTLLRRLGLKSTLYTEGDYEGNCYVPVLMPDQTTVVDLFGPDAQEYLFDNPDEIRKQVNEILAGKEKRDAPHLLPDSATMKSATTKKMERNFKDHYAGAFNRLMSEPQTKIADMKPGLEAIEYYRALLKQMDRDFVQAGLKADQRDIRHMVMGAAHVSAVAQALREEGCEVIVTEATSVGINTSPPVEETERYLVAKQYVEKLSRRRS